MSKKIALVVIYADCSIELRTALGQLFNRAQPPEIPSVGGAERLCGCSLTAPMYGTLSMRWQSPKASYSEPQSFLFTNNYIGLLGYGPDV
jgi:hypothetical protein